MLMQADKSVLLLVDVQEKLLSTIHEADELIANCCWSIKLAAHLNVPVLVSEQYPKGLGKTARQLQECLPKDTVYMEKLHFSCASDIECLQKINSFDRTQIILLGIEAHVCILQTAFGLQAEGKQVFVVADAISSRTSNDKYLAIERMRANNIAIVSKEMLLFEWLQQAGTPLFKEISRTFLQK